MIGKFDRPVSRRRVFYIPGYDPIHPRRYRELYRKEGAAQAEISGYQIDLVPKRTGGTYGWSVTGRIDGHETKADIDVLVWSDIVRGSMNASIPATYLQLVRTAWVYISTGALRRLARMRKGPVIAALYPIGMLLLQLLFSVGAGALIGTGLTWLLTLVADGIAWLFGTKISASAGWQWLMTGLFWCVLVGLTVDLLRRFKAADGRFFAYYLMHDYAYSAQWKGANPPALEARMAEFTQMIGAALQEDVDEVLVVGHSSGAHLAVSILADLIRQGGVTPTGPALSFLSLGQVVPMVSFLPKADRLRADLHYLAARPEITWIDVTAPGDGCAFALCDPVSVSGVAPDKKLWPLVFSAQFTRSLKPETWARLRWKFFRLHFQYLCAFDNPLDYDYFQITAGPVTLRMRYADRPPSNSRIDVAVSKYTSMAA